MTDTTKQAPIGTVMLKDVRLLYADLFVPKEFKEGDGKPRRSATFIIEPGSENDKAIRTAINAAATEKFKDKASQIKAWAQNPQKFCYTPGELKQSDATEGKMVLAGHRSAKQGPIGVFDNKGANGTPNPLTADDGRPYRGCYVNAKVEIWAQDGLNSGIRCTVVSVQFWRDGDAFASGARARAEDFGVADGAEDDVPF